MPARLRRAALMVCTFVFALGIATVAFADACTDAKNALEDARKAMANAMTAMQAADKAASDAAGTPRAAATKQAAQRASDAWLEANKDYLRKRNALDNCPDTTVEATFGRWSIASGSGTDEAIKAARGLTLGGLLTGNKDVGRGASAASALRAPDNSALGGVLVSAVGEIEFTRAFGATTPSFLGGARGTVLLKTHPEVRPFGELMFGIEHCGDCQTNDFAVEFGFGAVYRHWDRLGVVGEVSFRSLPGVDFAESETRIVGGVSYRLAPR